MTEFSAFGADPGGLVIDCETCTVRGVGCDDCVVTALLDMDGLTSEQDLELDADEARALDVLASGGLLPPLRLAPRAQTG
ncbi:MAG: hypothetical protein QOG53_3444 [Frankiales bacterium]|jgi:hypothetical protein|nr:hypothetical protein [Frankiales bacterium]